jgi:hypothetical protein
VQRDAAGVVGDVPGDVKDAVAQPLGFADSVLAVEAELLGPDHDVVRCQRELQPRSVRLECVEREVPGAGLLECLDAVLNFGVLAVQRLQRSDVVAVLVGDEALEAVSVQVRERELRSGVWALTGQISRVPSGHEERSSRLVSSVTHAPSRCSPSWLTAGIQALSSSVRICSRTLLLIG